MKKSILEIYKGHAKRYGTDAIMESAAADGMGELALIDLQKYCDSLAPAWAGKRRLSAETRVKRLLGLDKEEAECSDSSQPRAT